MASILSEYEAGPFNAGVNVSMQPQDIADDEAVVIQDMFLDKPGQIYSRGGINNVVDPFTPTFNTGTGNHKVVRSLMSAVSPDGVAHIGAVTQDTSSTNLYFTILADTGASQTFDITLDSSFPIASDCVVDAKPALGGGLWIGTQELPSSVNLVGRQALFHWRGGTKATYSTGTVTTSGASAVITGAGTTWVGNVTPGMFVFSSNTTLVGVVKSVDSNTQITLEAAAVNPSIAGALPSYSIAPIRGWVMEVSKGRISTTVSPGSPAVIGSGTKFLSTPLNTTWQIFRARDNQYIGTVLSVQGEEGLILNSSATLAMDNEPFTARSPSFNTLNVYVIPTTLATNSAYYPGVLNATYASLQWFARQDGPTGAGTGDLYSRVWFSDYRNQNSVDMVTQDGDYVNVPSTVGQNLPIRGLAPSANALLIFKENETFAITGNDSDSFDLQKIWDDGCLSPSSIVLYKGTVIWAGRRGIYLYDGKNVTNIVARSLGQKYVATMAGFDARKNKIQATEYNDHYFITINTNTAPGTGSYQVVYTIMKNGSINNTFTNHGFSSFCVYIPTRALSFLTNFSLCGSARTPTSQFFSNQEIINTNNQVCDFYNFFNRGLVDSEYTSVPYPDPYFESKRYNMKDPLRLKQTKLALITYGSTASGLTTTMEVAKGLGDSHTSSTWSVLATTLPSVAFGSWSTVLQKFLVRDRQIGIKLYQNTVNGTSGLMWLQRISLGFKWMKVGRV